MANIDTDAPIPAPVPGGAPPTEPGPDDAPAGEEAPSPDDLDAGGEEEVVATILRSPDGTYRLIPGDEPEGSDGGEEPAGTQFDSIGALLKGVLEVVKTYEEQSPGAEGSDEENFQAGYSGGATGAVPAKPMMGGGGP